MWARLLSMETSRRDRSERSTSVGSMGSAGKTPLATSCRVNRDAGEAQGMSGHQRQGD